MNSFKLKCLFTEEGITDHEDEEHLIPRMIGGRITSTKLCSSAFNHQAGSFCDNQLVDTYKIMFQILSPILRSEHKRIGRVFGEDDAGKKVYLQKGFLKPKGLTFEKDKGKLKSVRGTQVDLDKYFRSQNIKEKPGTSIIPVSHRIITRVKVLHPEIDVALLKSILSVFDYFEDNHPENYIRSDALKDVRQFVKDTVKLRLVNSVEWRKYCWGIQYESERIIFNLLQKAKLMPGPFDHTLVLSANPPTRTIDAIFLVAGIDPFCFRLTQEWAGRGFTKVFVHPVLKNTSMFTPVELPESSTLFGVSSRKPIIEEGEFQATPIEHAKQICYQRSAKLNEASLFVERSIEGAEHLVTALIELSTNVYPSLTLSEVLCERVKIWYPHLDDKVKNSLSDFMKNQFTNSKFESFKRKSIKQGELLDSTWKEILSIYRSILDAVIDQFGTPKVQNDTELFSDDSFRVYGKQTKF
jgi:hypothetical protein